MIRCLSFFALTQPHKFDSGYWHIVTMNYLVLSGLPTTASVSTWMDDRISMSISGESPLNETLNRGLLHCSCGDSINFSLGLT